MMMKRSNLLLICISIFLTTNAFSASSKKWVLATEKISYEAAASKNSSVIQGAAEMFPDRILEKMTMTLYRNLDNQEEVDRELYELKQTRTSLVLQLSSEIKRRDSLVLENYSQKEFQKKIKTQEEKIQEIKDKLKENRDKTEEILKNLESRTELNTETELNKSNSVNKTEKKQNSDSELDKISDLFLNMFVDDKNELVTEQISLYRNDITARYESNLKESEKSYTSRAFEKEMVSANINALMNGKLSVIADYYFLNIEIYLYPGCRKIAVASEVGTLDEADFIASSIARQLTPALTNALPVEINFIYSFAEEDDETEAEEETEKITEKPAVKAYIDSVVYSQIPESLVLQSGVHDMQFEAEGYKPCGTSYYFAGNRTYTVELNFEKAEDIRFTVDLLKPLKTEESEETVEGTGTLTVNGNALEKDIYGRSVVKVNGSIVLGQYYSEQEGNAFFYLPENKIINNQNYSLKLSPANRDEYIEKHRRRMYTSYSLLVSSLIPYFYCKGQADNYTAAYALDSLTDEQIKVANRWILSSNITAGISVTCGVWFAYELVRYLIAANSVLPVQAKPYNKTDYEVVPQKTEDINKTENQIENKTENKIEENTEGEE